MTKRIQDLNNYRKMSNPHETETDATLALQGFLTDVMAARQKWRVPEVIVGCSGYFGTEVKVLSMFQQFGDLLFAPVLVQQMQNRTLEELTEIILEQSQELRELKETGQLPLIKDENKS